MEHIDTQPTYTNIIPYTHTKEAYDLCCKDNENEPVNLIANCPMVCLPCTIIADIICCFPMLFGVYTIKPVQN